MTLIDFSLPKLDPTLSAAAQSKIDAKTKPLGSLGKIESLAKQLCLIQNTLTPAADECELLLFAGDHGIAESGVSAFPADVTKQMVLNFLEGGAAANVFANLHRVGLTVIDTGMKGDALESPTLVSKRISAGTQNFLHHPAMTRDQLNTALSNGDELVSQCKAPVLAFGEMGIANTSSAAVITNKLTNYSLASLVGRGTGLDDAGLSHKLDVLEQASARTQDSLDAMTCLAEYGGFEIVTMAGAMLGAARRSKCLLIDGYISTAALLAVHAIEPNVLDYCVFAHTSAESGHQLMLEHLGVSALFDLDLRLGEGSGALLAWPLIQSAAAMINEMASFEEAGVSEKS